MIQTENEAAGIKELEEYYEILDSPVLSKNYCSLEW